MCWEFWFLVEGEGCGLVLCGFLVTMRWSVELLSAAKAFACHGSSVGSSPKAKVAGEC